jgi:tRNA G10  N-methylase Trm11
MIRQLPPLPAQFEYRLEWAGHVTPRMLKNQPVHRWFYFPHSFSPQLVETLLDEWRIPAGGMILDPFVGAGTTLCAAAHKGYRALGVDLSPLAVFVSNTKVRHYQPRQVRRALQDVFAIANRSADIDLTRTDRLERAFTDAEFLLLSQLRQAIASQPEPYRSLLLLALLRVQQQISRAKPDGGWFRWIERECQAASIFPAFAAHVELMLSDLPHPPEAAQPVPFCEACLHDARQLEALQARYPQLSAGCQAIITSPPYPNRHDYSRIFQIELLTLGLREADVFTLRYESIRSNVEARAPSYAVPPLPETELLENTLAALPQNADERIEPMLRGYFTDMNAVLHAAFRVLAPGGYVALVVGNVRHAGVMIPVDELLLHLGQVLGFVPQISWVARLRGNSAQQMGRYGREAARESVVILQKP